MNLLLLTRTSRNISSPKQFLSFLLCLPLTLRYNLHMKVSQSCLTLCHPMDYTVPGILQARTLERVAVPFSMDLPNPGIESPTLQVDSLPAEPPEKPKNTGVGSLSLLQRIFWTQESNRGLLHCRLILYQLSYQGALWNEYLSRPNQVVVFK